MQRATVLHIMMIVSLTGGAHAATLEEIEQLVDEKWRDVTSFRADISVEMKIPMGMINVPSNAEGTIELVAANGERKYRIDITNHLAKSFLLRKGLTQEVLTVYDGEFEYTELTVFGRKQVNKRAPDESDSNRPLGGSAVFDRLRKQGEVILAGETTIDGRPVWIIDVTGNGKPVDVKGPVEPDRIRVYIAQDSGLQVRSVMYDDQNEEIMRMRYSNVELNQKLDPSRFEYTPPEGVEIKEGPPSEQ